MTDLAKFAGFLFALLMAGPAFAAEKTITLKVDGMTCASCPYMVRKSLTKVDGVKAVAVSLQTKLAVVTYDDAKANVEALTSATFEAGFPSQVKPAGAAEPASVTMIPTVRGKTLPRGSN